MYPDIELDKLIPEHGIRGEDKHETQELHQLLSQAKEYITNFTWCPPIVESYLGIGIGGVLGVFLFKFSKKINDTDEWLWVIEGDLPSAYLVIDEAPNACKSLEIYADLMEEWALKVIGSESTENFFPVNVPENKDYAKMLLSRISFIRKEILSNY